MIKKHPVIGKQILETIKEMPNLSSGARWHHERFDGKGYPDGLAGEDIPEVARIIAVADAYDAMTSKRSYRDTLPQDKVREELINCSGTQFDPRFAQVMVELIDEDKDYQMREL
ncbi:MAG: HD domain-containing protein [Lachnospiraceae bacterium]|nr:HD domain-containing protein [Lachnospiraceae bacterium]